MLSFVARRSIEKLGAFLTDMCAAALACTCARDLVDVVKVRTQSHTSDAHDTHDTILSSLSQLIITINFNVENKNDSSKFDNE